MVVRGIPSLLLPLALVLPARAAYVPTPLLRRVAVSSCEAARCAGAAAVLNISPRGAAEVPPRDPRPRRNGEHTPQQQTVTGPPERRAASVPLPPASDGFVFGRQSVEAVLAALRNGSIVLLLEDGEETTRASLVASAAHVSTEQLQFLLEHTVRLQAALETERYRTVYRSLRRIVLDNNDLSRPAISVSARCGGTSPRNATHVARAVHALLADALTDGSEEEEAEAKAEAKAEASAAAAAAASGQPVRRVGRDPAREVCASVSSLVCPGAVSLGSVREGGVLRRAGATEASVELAKLAGLPAVGLHASLRIHSRTELELFAQRHHLTVSSTADLVAYVRSKQQLVERTGPPARMPTKFGRFIAHTYRSRVDGTEHIALVKARYDDDDAAADRGSSSSSSDSSSGSSSGSSGSSGSSSSGGGDAFGSDLPNMVSDYPLKPFAGRPERPVLVRVHSECCTGDVFGSLRCDCGVQLEAALEDIERDGWGVLLYLRGQEGRGIGLGAKMHAYALQERGVDTLDANLQLGLPADSREYGTGAQILADLGIGDMRLMSNNPKKFAGLTGYGLRIVERVPSLTAPNPDNLEYLRTKRRRMGHMIELDDEGVQMSDGVGSEDGVEAQAVRAQVEAEAEAEEVPQTPREPS